MIEQPVISRAALAKHLGVARGIDQRLPLVGGLKRQVELIRGKVGEGIEGLQTMSAAYHAVVGFQLHFGDFEAGVAVRADCRSLHFNACVRTGTTSHPRKSGRPYRTIVDR